MKNPVSTAVESASPSAPTIEISGPPAPRASSSVPPGFSAPLAVGQFVPGVPVDAEPMRSSIYQFQHREAPGEDQLQKLSVLGVVAVSDSQSRTVMVRGPVESIQSAVQYLAALDKMPGFCSVQTWAVFVDRSVQKGFDLSAAISSTVPDVNAMSVGNGAFTLDLSSGDVALALSIIADGTTVEVLQRPNIRLSHGTASKLESIQEVPIPQTTLSNGIAQTSIQYRKVGLQLDVTPFFLGNNWVRLSVNQSNGLVGNTVEIEGNAIPTIQSQTVQTVAQLVIGQTVILGGVTTQRFRKSRGFLHDITEVQEGSLYVILSTYEDAPKAVPVGTPRPEGFPGVPIPLSGPGVDPSDWIDSQLLPPKKWQREERKFLKARFAK